MLTTKTFLLHRKLLLISGPTACKFLQNLCSNDLSVYDPTAKPPIQRRIIKFSEQQAPPVKPPPPPALYAGFFTPKGRVLYDAIITPCKPLDQYPSDQPVDSFFIDCDARVASDLLAHLQKYKLRSKLVLEDVSQDHTVVAHVGPLPSTPATPLSPAFYADPRLPALGFRAIVPAAACASIPSDDPELYRALLLIHGVPEGPEALVPEHTLPMETGMDLLHGISFEKGCYIGQELTARVHHSGVIRKRYYPVVQTTAQDDFSSLPIVAELKAQLEQSYLTPGFPDALCRVDSEDTLIDLPAAPAPIFILNQKSEAGTLLTANSRIGIAHLRTEHILGSQKFSYQQSDFSTHLVPVCPPYLLPVLNKEVEQNQGVQQE